jgi:hypothetical protein
MGMKKKVIVIAHSGLERKITEKECRDSIEDGNHSVEHFVDFEISKAKLQDLYGLPYEQLALEQQRKFKGEVEPILLNNPEAVIAYFGLAPIPLAFQLGVLINNFSEYWIYQFHHQDKVWYRNIEPLAGYNFGIAELQLPTKVEKGKGDVFIRVGTSYRIEPQHTYEVLPNPTNEFDLNLISPSVDGISTQEELSLVLNKFQEILSAFANNLPDRDKIHLFMATTTGLTFALGTKINQNVFPFIQTYQFSRDETPKYKEAILISKRNDAVVTINEKDKELAGDLRRKWASELSEKIIPFITSNKNVFADWFNHVVQNDPKLRTCLKGSWENLPDLSKTSLMTDQIDEAATTVENGFKYDNRESKWQIDDGMFISLSHRLSRAKNTDLMRAGRLFLFHEGLHYCQDGHCLTEEIANGIGRFPKVIEEADYQADVWALLYEFRFSYTQNPKALDENLKKFFLDAIETAVETMWSFVDTGEELTIMQIRSMNRFLNWYWQWVRIERLQGSGKLKEIIEILFDKPVIEFAGAEIITLDRQRTCFKLNMKPLTNYELAIFFKNKVYRFAPTRITKIVEGFRELSGTKIKEGLRSFLVNLG